MSMRRSTFTSAAVAGALAAGLLITVHESWPDGCPERPRTLTVLGDKDVSSGRQRKELIENWRGRDGMRAELRELPGVADLQHAQAVATAQGGGCGIDVYILDGPWVAEFAEAGYLRPIAEGALADLEKREPLNALLPGALRRSGYFDGRLWAVPLSADAPLLYYRKDLLDAAGFRPPESWPELWEQAEKVLASPHGDLKAGYAAQLARYEGFTVNALELMWAHDDGDLVEDGEVEINPTALRSISEKLGPADGRTLIARDSFVWHEDEATEAFFSGRTLFLRNWPTAYRRLAEDPSLKKEADLTAKYGVAPLPGQGVLGGQLLAVAARSPYRDEARDLIGELTGYDAQHRLFWCGGFAPVRTEVYERRGAEDCESAKPEDPDKRVVRHLPWEFMPALRQAVERARPRPESPSYTRFSFVFQDLMYCGLQTPPLTSSCSRPSAAPAFPGDLEDRLTEALNGR